MFDENNKHIEFKNLSWERVSEFISLFDLKINSLGLSRITSNGNHIDAFSKCQLYTKYRLALLFDRVIRSSGLDVGRPRIAVCGSWVGTTLACIDAVMQKFNKDFIIRADCFDLDPEAIDISKDVFLDYSSVSSFVQDIHDVNYDDYDIIINPIMEHIPDTKKWLKVIPSGKEVIMTSTNFADPIDHINLVNSMDEFKKSVENYINIDRTINIGFPIYDRYIIQGRTM